MGETPRHQGLRPHKEQVVRVRPISPADRIDVAGPLGDEQGRRRAPALDQRVDRHGRAVDELRDVAKGETARLNAVQHAADKTVGRAEPLGGVETSNSVVEADKVGESTTDVYCDKKQCHSSALRFAHSLAHVLIAARSTIVRCAVRSVSVVARGHIEKPVSRHILISRLSIWPPRFCLGFDGYGSHLDDMFASAAASLKAADIRRSSTASPKFLSYALPRRVGKGALFAPCPRGPGHTSGPGGHALLCPPYDDRFHGIDLLGADGGARMRGEA